LKQFKETLIPQLEKQCQLLQSELDNRGVYCDCVLYLVQSVRIFFVHYFIIDLTATAVSNERAAHFEQQCKEYRDNIRQLTNDSERMRIDLKRIQDEYLLKDKQHTDSLNEYKQKCDQLQQELNDRGEIRSFFCCCSIELIICSYELH
jgi:DNA repair exonuclease SbcCD ATPase subunit